MAAKQRLSEFDFESADLFGQCRLRGLQHNGGAREAAELGDMHEGFELAQVHGGGYALTYAGLE